MTESGWVKFNYTVSKKHQPAASQRRHIASQTYDNDFEEYEDWEDYYYDNEDDLRYYYGI